MTATRRTYVVTVLVEVAARGEFTPDNVRSEIAYNLNRGSWSIATSVQGTLGVGRSRVIAIEPTKRRIGA